MTLPDVGTLFTSPCLKERICGTTVHAWSAHQKGPSSHLPIGTFMKNTGLTTSLTLWTAWWKTRSLVGTYAAQVPCRGHGCRFAVPGRGRGEAAALLPATPPGDTDTVLEHATATPAGLTFGFAPVGSRWYSLEDTTRFKTEDTNIIEPGDITSSCGLRDPVSRGTVINGSWS